MRKKGLIKPSDMRVKAIKEIASMNEELLRWIEETERKGVLPEKIREASEKSREKPLGKCQVCGKRDAKAVCIKCGRKVCLSCYFNLVGLCEKCLSKSTVEKWKSSRPDWEKVLGVEWVD